MRLLSRRLFLPILLLSVLSGRGGGALQDRPLQELMPERIEDGGWQKHLEAQEYEGEDLYLYIDGGAEIYQEYGFHRVIFQDYISLKGKKLSVEVFEMKTSASAFGMYTFKTGSKGKAISLGTQGRLEGYYLNFWKGQFLVTITGFEEGPETEGGLLAVAHAVEARLPRDPDPGLPPLVRCLPPEGLIPASIEYFSGHLGLFNTYPFSTSDVFRFKEGVRGSYERGYDLYLLEYDSTQESRKSLVRVRTELVANPRYVGFSDLGQALELRDDRDTLIHIMRYQRLIVIVLGAEDSAQAKKIAEGVSIRR